MAQAEHNEIVALELADAGHYDWALTALFYAALHLVQAFFVSSRLTVSNHQQRDIAMRRSTSISTIRLSYWLLRYLSENARYDCRQFSREHFDDVRERHYAPIRAHLMALFPGGRA